MQPVMFAERCDVPGEGSGATDAKLIVPESKVVCYVDGAGL